MEENANPIAAVTIAEETVAAPALPPGGWLYPRIQERGEWWYYSGTLDAEGKTYSFHVAFFRFSSEGYTIGRWIPLAAFTSDVALAHATLNCHHTNRTWLPSVEI